VPSTSAQSSANHGAWPTLATHSSGSNSAVATSPRAAALAEESLAEWRMTERWSDIAQELYYAASAYRRVDNLPRANSLPNEGLALAVRARDWAVAVECLEEAAALAAARGDIEQALRLRGAVQAWRDTSGFSWSLDHGEQGQLEQTLTETEAQRLLGEGGAMSLEAAVAYALKELSGQAGVTVEERRRREL
jgi:hypothetical protein